MKKPDHKRAAKNGRKLSLRRLSACVGASLGALVLAVAVLIFVFGGAILNRYGKAKAERAFAEAHPGYALRIGELDYAMGANRLVAQSVTLSSTNTTLKVGRISLTGVRWARLLWGTAALADVLAKASLDATNLDVEFPQAQLRDPLRAAASVGAGFRTDRRRDRAAGRWPETKHSSRRTLFEHRGFVSSCRSAECWVWRLANCSREDPTGPGRFIFPAPPLRR